jgi:membrane protein
VREILFELVQARVLSEVVKNGGRDVAYQPAVDIDMITVKYVIDAMEHSGTDDIPVGRSPELDTLNDCLCRFGQTIAEHPCNVRLEELEASEKG